MTYRPLALKENKSTYLFRRPKQVQRDHQQDMEKKEKEKNKRHKYIDQQQGWAVFLGFNE